MSSAQSVQSLTLFILCDGFAIARESRAIHGTVRDQMGYVRWTVAIVWWNPRREGAALLRPMEWLVNCDIDSDIAFQS